MDDKSLTHSVEEVGLPTRQQVMALALAQVEEGLKDLMQLREADEDWDDVDVDVDYTISLAYCQVRRMKDLQQEDGDFEWQWWMVAAPLNMAVKLFSRRDCRYWRALNSLCNCFEPFHDLMERAAGQETAAG